MKFINEHMTDRQTDRRGDRQGDIAAFASRFLQISLFFSARRAQSVSTEGSSNCCRQPGQPREVRQVSRGEVGGHMLWQDERHQLSSALGCPRCPGSLSRHEFLIEIRADEK